ncbi:MarR family transcriptional regulator [Mizugakiibacter sediminis]|uniref:MarR family transcriptional regulator n=1 Tax=Mizugakiibacter sediminis TaxID=1475481 RepID=A0A0K8QRN6_9GAMM|nr:MarR family transcriptional regulator [Mizugakiibacter sediminis]GAP67321.1 MarR family transcriptional regulator [Mizugakiibacter sediminis]
MTGHDRPLTARVEALREGVRRVNAKLPDLPAREVVLMRMLCLLGWEFTTNLDRRLRKHGLNDTDFRTLMVLFSSPDGMAHPSDLCHLVTLSRTNMTRIGDVLVARGLVTRTPSLEDRRRIVMRITAKGEALVRKLVPPLYPVLTALFADFGVREKRQLEALLLRLAAAFDAVDFRKES